MGNVDLVPIPHVLLGLVRSVTDYTIDGSLTLLG